MKIRQIKKNITAQQYADNAAVRRKNDPRYVERKEMTVRSNECFSSLL